MRPLAHATHVSRITITRLRKVMGLTGFCERCGAATQKVVFFSDGTVVEACAVCCADANVSEDMELAR